MLLLSRIENALNQRKAVGKKGFIPFIMAGDPDMLALEVDRATGAPTTGEGGITETFIAGTQPVQ